MFVELFFAVFLGIICGTITGITPGVHINLVSLLLLHAASFLLQYISPITIAAFIVSMAVTHTFLDIVPSVFLGAPDAETVAIILPCHKLLLQGKAFDAVKLTIVGSFLALILSLFLLPLLFFIVPIIYQSINAWIGYILFASVAYLIFKDKQRWWNLFIF